MKNKPVTLKKILSKEDLPVTKKQTKIKSSGFLNKSKRIRKNYVVDAATVENMDDILEYTSKKLNMKLTHTDIFQIAMKGIAKRPSLIAKFIKAWYIIFTYVLHKVYV